MTAENAHRPSATTIPATVRFGDSFFIQTNAREAGPTYWDIIEAALTALPEEYPLRKDALAAFDHLKERVLANHAALVAGERSSS